MAPKHYLLIANGELDCSDFKRVDLTQFTGVIALDGGATRSLECGIPPDVIIGDLDSIPENYRGKFDNSQFIHKPSQDMNDLEKGIIYCTGEQADELTILGLTGGRTDHLFNNFSVLARYDRKISITVIDKHARILLIRNNYQFQGKPGQIISLIPMGKVKGITTRGLKYALKNESLEFGVREGLSNVITGSPVSISSESGMLLLFIHWPDHL
ncbi:MAG: thiamine diphosphokinase [Calditrichota bacterium]|jgi:thiamine pyrophosphokinase